MADKASIKLVSLEGSECLRFHFGEYLETLEAQRLVDEWKSIFASRPETRFILVWDCLQMKGYDSEARKSWTRALKEMKAQIQEIWIISDSSLIKMGAGIMAMITQIKMRIFSSESQVFSK